MRVSFDLDGVLFVPPATYETEDPLRFPLNRLYPNRLRKGSIKLIHTLQEEGFEVWVYTSSFRNEWYIRNLFRHYGIRLDGIVNGFRTLLVSDPDEHWDTKVLAEAWRIRKMENRS